MNDLTFEKRTKAVTPFVEKVVEMATKDIVPLREGFYLFHIRQDDDGSARVATATNLKPEGVIKLLEDAIAAMKMVN